MTRKVILKSDLTDYPKQDRSLRKTNYISLFGDIRDLTVGKCYEATVSPIMYDPNTFEKIRSYIIYCDDGYARKFPLDYFITLEEWRDLQLQKLL